MRKVLIVMFFCLSMGGFSMAQDKITVKMPISNRDQYLQLAQYYGYKQVFKLDSAKVNSDGLIVFENKTTSPWQGGMYLIMDNKGKYYDFVWSGKESDIFMEFDTANFIQSAKFKKSPENDHMFKYKRSLAAVNEQGKNLENLLKSEKDPAKVAQLRSNFGKEQKQFNRDLKSLALSKPELFASVLMKANLEPELPETPPTLPNGKPDSTYFYRTYKAQFLENIDFSDARLIRTPFLEGKLERYFSSLVLPTTDSLVKEVDYVLTKTKSSEDMYRYVLWYLTNKYETTDIVGLDGVVVHLYENYYLKDASWIDENQRQRFADRLAVIKPLQTGSVMPNMVLKGLDGKAEDLSKFKAKYTIVYFYSPTCSHCKDHAPSLTKFQDENRNKGFEVWNISTDRNKEEVEKFVKTYDMGRMKNLYDPEGNYDFITKYDVYSTPTLYVLDENKRIIGKRIPIEEIHRFLEFQERSTKK